jgi:hypothetical protein
VPAREPQPGPHTAKRPRTAGKPRPLTLHIAEQLGRAAGSKTTHVNAKVPTRLFTTAARRSGSTSPAAVITAALATEDEPVRWLARRWGALADLDPDLLAQLDL